MKKTILLVLVFILFHSATQGQTDNVKVKYAFERVSAKRWDNFKPKWLFWLFFKKYKSTDKRMVPLEAQYLTLKAAQNKLSEIEQTSLDSIYDHSKFIALDRISNKQWHLFYKKDVETLMEKIENELDTIYVKGELSQEEIMAFELMYMLSREGIFIMLDSYIDDAQKAEAIKMYLGHLKLFYQKLITIRTMYEILANNQDLSNLNATIEKVKNELMQDYDPFILEEN